MALKSAPFYWLECDGCKVRSTEESDFSAWADDGMAEEEAASSDWIVEDDRHLCVKCSEGLRCPDCGEPKPSADSPCPDPKCAAGATPPREEAAAP